LHYFPNDLDKFW